MGYSHSPADVTLAAAETILRRLPILWWAAVWPSPAAHAETRHMVVEKQMALVEGLLAFQVEFTKLWFQPWWAARLPHEAAQHLAQAATAPAARRVKANARRLRR